MSHLKEKSLENIQHCMCQLLLVKKKLKQKTAVHLLLKVHANAGMFLEWKDCFSLN